MSTKLAKIEAKNEQLRKANATKAAKQKMDGRRIITMLAGGAGGLTSAVGCAVLDGKQTKEGEDYATFGESGIPINATIGALLAITAPLYAKKAPAVANFAFTGGLSAVVTTAYVAVRNKVEDAAD